MKNNDDIIHTAKTISVAILALCLIASPIIAIALIWFFTPTILKIAGTILVLGLVSIGSFYLLESIED